MPSSQAIRIQTSLSSDQGHSQSSKGVGLGCDLAADSNLLPSAVDPPHQGDRPEISLTIHYIHLVTETEPQDPSEVVAF